MSVCAYRLYRVMPDLNGVIVLIVAAIKVAQ